MKYHIEKNTVQETLVIPLFGRLVCSERFPELFSDLEAKRICDALDYDFAEKRKKMESPAGLFGALEVAQRQYDLRCEVENYLKKHPKAAVVNLGCGLDDTFSKVDNGLCRGYNLDFPDVIKVRNELLHAGDREKNIACNLNNFTWMDKVDAVNGAVFFAAGVFYYFKTKEVKKLFTKMAERFPGAVLVFDSKGMIRGTLAGAVGCIGLSAACGCTGLIKNKTAKTAATGVLLFTGAAAGGAALWMTAMYRAFSYDGKRQMSRQIIEGISEHVKLPDGGIGLDVGCGSGAFAIACAKRNSKASFVGIDRWGKEYASFSKSLCESNAKAEGVSNVSFERGDATQLYFTDESSDAVVSNYVYHNIPGDRQELLLETLRVLKEGGTFAIHDIFSKSKYGDMQAFIQKLKDMGYEEVRLIDTTEGTFIAKKEAVWMALSGSALLVGRK